MAFAKIYDELKALNVNLIGLSVDSISAHLAWVHDIKEKMGVSIPFPIIADLTMKDYAVDEAPTRVTGGVPATVEVYRGNRPEKVQTQIFPDGGRLWSYKAEMIHFVDCVLTGKPFRSPASDTLHDVALFEEIFKRHVKACRK
jgi:hypothetical protein